MRVYKYLFVLSTLVLGGCDSGSDDVNTTTNYITEVQAVTPVNEQNLIGDFELKTAIETDFFVVATEIDSLEFYYSNSNAFHFDKDGYLVNSSGFPLMVYPVNSDGSSASVSISTSQPVQINYTMGSPEATDRVNVGINLPETASELSANEFDKDNPLTFNNSTSVSVFDSLGDVHVLTFYFIHVNADNNTWELHVSLDDNAVQQNQEQLLDFNSSGLMDLNDDDHDGFTTAGNGLIEDINIPLNNGANDLTITLDFTSDTTSFNSNFEVTSLDASGFYTGHIEELKIESNGLVTLFYTNGEYELIGKVALAKFFSPYNLNPLDNFLWAETEDSGTPIYGEPEFGNFGSIIPLTHDF